MHLPGTYEAYLFDLDGTIYLGDELLPGAAALVTELRRRDVPVRFVSNNPTKDPHEYADKLRRLGLPTPVTDVVNTVVATVSWLLAERPGATVYPIAEEPVRRALAAAGIRMSDDPAEIDVVLASYDRTLTYDKLRIAFDAIWFHRRAELVSTNPDRYCPLPGGRGEPDAAGVVAAIEATTGTTLSTTIGKPDPAMARAAVAGLGVDLSRCVMVGDRLGTDIAMAKAAGMASALVLTGDSSLADVRAAPPGRRPDRVISTLLELMPAAAGCTTKETM